VSRREKLLERVRNNPRNVRLDDLCTLLTGFGFELAREAGSHRIFRHPGPPPRTCNVQRQPDGKAKPCQVEQVLEAIDALTR